jgi:nitrogen fixation protein FixH
VNKGSLWPWVIGAALALHVIGSLVVVAVATSDPSYSVEEDYYRKAVNWDEKRAQDRTNAELGWSLEFEVVPPQRPSEQPTIEVRLADKAGEPLTGASVNLETFHKARSNDVIRLEIDPTAEAGLYAARPAMRRNGLWELRFTVGLDGDRFTHTETRHLLVEGSWQ